MKLLLTSAGLRNEDIIAALQGLVGKPFVEASFLFIPTAANLDTGDKGWLLEDIERFKKQGFKSVAVVDIAEPSLEELKPYFLEADIICFGGGNERYLARMIEEKNLKEFLVPLLDTKVYMGISAGSMVAGHFLKRGVSDAIFTEEDSGEWGGNPMELYDFAFVPHLNSTWFKFEKDRLEGLKDKFDVTVYATDDETAIKIDGEKIEIVGKRETWVQKK